MAGRPKLDDPTVPVSFRMKRSASEWWTSKARQEGTSLPKLIRRVLEERAEHGRLLDANFKKGGKR
jgi:hypothetical protein